MKSIRWIQLIQSDGFISALHAFSSERVRTERGGWSTTYNGLYHVYFGNLNYLQYQKQHQQMHLQPSDETATGPYPYPSAATVDDADGVHPLRLRVAPA